MTEGGGADMSKQQKRWGVEVIGPDKEKALWMKVLKPPFDPFLEKIEDPRGEFHVLISSEFDRLTEAVDVQQWASRLVPLINATMRNIHGFDAMTIGGIVDFAAEGNPKKIYFSSASIIGRSRIFAEVKRRDADGNEIPTQSNVQRWMQAAERSSEIASAIGYLSHEATWYDFYKACEALVGFPHPGISNKRRNALKRTADWHRHHRSSASKNPPPPDPMELSEARSLLVRWLNAAVDEVLRP
jgi:hypothetical protein